MRFLVWPRPRKSRIQRCILQKLKRARLWHDPARTNVRTPHHTRITSTGIFLEAGETKKRSKLQRTGSTSVGKSGNIATKATNDSPRVCASSAAENSDVREEQAVDWPLGNTPPLLPGKSPRSPWCSRGSRFFFFWNLVTASASLSRVECPESSDALQKTRGQF